MLLLPTALLWDASK
uniref:Uncharacterized protein n=1 Tax=Arundo donax TaxID=35708 RepID=A0A0A9AF93_ARUDO